MTGRSQIWDGAQWIPMAGISGPKGDTGDTGPPGEGGELSTDAGNQAILGTDSLHYVPEFADGVYLKLTGGVISGQVDFNADTDFKNNRLKNVGTPVVGTDGLSQTRADGRYLALSGGTVTGATTFNSEITLVNSGFVLSTVGAGGGVGQIRNIHRSTADPTTGDGNHGDTWYVY